MTRTLRYFGIATLAILLLTAVGYSQMMGGHGHAMNATPDSTAGNTMGMGHGMGGGMNMMGGMMGGMMGNMMDMMSRMNTNGTMMSSNFDSLETRLHGMMQINDIKSLKSAMGEFQGMMQAMHQRMSTQQSMLQNMMNMAQTGSPDSQSPANRASAPHACGNSQNCGH